MTLAESCEPNGAIGCEEAWRGAGGVGFALSCGVVSVTGRLASVFSSASNVES